MNDEQLFEERLSVYLESFELKQSDLLSQIRKKALLDNVPILRVETARLMRFLMKVLRPKKILEVGCAVGYSALLMNEALGDVEGVSITTIENYEKRIAVAKENFKVADATDRITLLEGDASEILETLPDEAYDFVFMDAAKAQYIVWLNQIKRVLKKGGVLCTDNILQEGDLLSSRYLVTRRDRTIHTRMREYVDTLMHSEDFDTTLLNVGDGVTLSYKL